MGGACAFVYLSLVNNCSAILFHLLVIARFFVFFPPSLFFLAFAFPPSLPLHHFNSNLTLLVTIFLPLF